LPADGLHAGIGEAQRRGLIGRLSRELLADSTAGLGDIIGLDAIVSKAVHRVGEAVGERESADGKKFGGGLTAKEKMKWAARARQDTHA